MPEAIWVDFGGVLTPPAVELLSAFCRRAGVAPEQLVVATVAVARAYGSDDPMEPLEVPLVDEASWGAQVARELRERFGVNVDMSSFAERWLDGHSADGTWLERLPALRGRGHFVGLLSNMMPSFEPHWRSIAPPERLFDDVVLSFDVGLRKPQREIFELAARRAGAEPRDCVLVDDLDRNCDAARAAGWRAIRCLDARAAIGELEALVGAAAR